MNQSVFSKINFQTITKMNKEDESFYLSVLQEDIAEILELLRNAQQEDAINIVLQVILLALSTEFHEIGDIDGFFCALRTLRRMLSQSF